MTRLRRAKLIIHVRNFIFSVKTKYNELAKNKILIISPRQLNFKSNLSNISGGKTATYFPTVGRGSFKYE
jgi:hypothetical protein